MTKSSKTAETSPVADFENALDELEKAVAAMEKGDQSLDQSLATYERGIALYRRCQLALEQAEQRVSQVNNGNTENLTAFRESDES